MKPAAQILAALIVILLLGAVLTGIQLFRGGEYTDTFNVTTTSENSTTVTLSQELLDDETSNASVSSNYTHDAPVTSSYATATQALTIVGLQSSTQRLLTVTYKYPQLENYWGADLAARAWPLIIALGVIGIIVGAVYNSMSKRE